MYGCEPEGDRGKFHVEDYCFQELPEQVPRPKLEEDRCVPDVCIDLGLTFMLFSTGRSILNVCFSLK